MVGDTHTFNLSGFSKELMDGTKRRCYKAYADLSTLLLIGSMTTVRNSSRALYGGPLLLDDRFPWSSRGKEENKANGYGRRASWSSNPYLLARVGDVWWSVVLVKMGLWVLL